MPGATLRRRVGRAGRPMGVASFAGTSAQFLSLADNAALSMGVGARLTICAWLFPTSFASVSAPISKGAAFLPATLEYATQVNTSGSWSLRVSDGTTIRNSNGVTLGLNQWNFAMGQYDGTNLLASLNGGAFTAAVAGADIQDMANPFRLGLFGGGGSAYTGLLSRVGIAGSALSAAEITELYNGGASKAFAQVSPALAAKFSAYWDLDDAGGSGATWLDKASTNHLTAGTGTAAPTAVTVWR